jgi:hypothetical protein
MADPMYLLDFRRMSVEKVDDPKPPPGLGSRTLPAAADTRNVGITFAALGSPPRRDDDEE